jgi:hypothetical protein
MFLIWLVIFHDIRYDGDIIPSNECRKHTASRYIPVDKQIVSTHRTFVRQLILTQNDLNLSNFEQLSLKDAAARAPEQECQHIIQITESLLVHAFVLQRQYNDRTD